MWEVARKGLWGRGAGVGQGLKQASRSICCYSYISKLLCYIDSDHYTASMEPLLSYSGRSTLSYFHTSPAAQIDSYHYIDGMESLLGRLKGAGLQMHAMSNYPRYYE